MTQIESAKKGIITDEMKTVAKYEDIDVEKLRRYVAKGYVVIPKNVNRDIKAVGIGKELTTKVNANIGTSPDLVDINLEVEKAKIAKKYGADTIMDLSVGGDLDKIRKEILKAVDIPLGTVPIYEVAKIAKEKYGKVVEMDEDLIFNVIEKQAKQGVDFMTLHCGINKNSVERLKRSGRVLGVVSRGGSFLVAYILHTGEENPLYKNYDYLMELLREYDVTISLGDGLRPGCLLDNTDRAQIEELIILGELVERAREMNVQAMVEGPGHVPLNYIGTNIKLQKRLCKEAPFYVLGPIVTDIAPGYDHITSAIGGALAGYYGADFLCYVTPAEHLRLPNIEDVKEGVIAAKIAAQAADVAKGNKLALKKEKEMAYARKNHDWEKIYNLAIDKEKAKKMREEIPPKEEKACSICGEFCALLMVKEFLEKNKK
ncbi:phosphomethylpyrimidine synthase [Methanocaldococcus indicus]|uniref:phosphomethylpyrimidine synthase n=1 Tax=Methanocaldococcus indicus TaxID=213231 RepID=UPI003C6D6C4E